MLSGEYKRKGNCSEKDSSKASSVARATSNTKSSANPNQANAPYSSAMRRSGTASNISMAPPMFPSFPRAPMPFAPPLIAIPPATPAPFLFDYYYSDGYSGHVYFYKNAAGDAPASNASSLVQVLPIAVARPYMAYFDQQPTPQSDDHKDSATNSSKDSSLHPEAVELQKSVASSTPEIPSHSYSTDFVPPPPAQITPFAHKVNFFEGDEEFRAGMRAPSISESHQSVGSQIPHHNHSQSEPVVAATLSSPPPSSMIRKRSHNPYGFGPSISATPTAPSHAASTSSKSSAYLTAATSSIYSHSRPGGGGGSTFGPHVTHSSAVLAGTGGGFGAMALQRDSISSAPSSGLAPPPPPLTALLSTNPMAASSCDEAASAPWTNSPLSKQPSMVEIGSFAGNINTIQAKSTAPHTPANVPYSSAYSTSHSRSTPIAVPSATLGGAAASEYSPGTQHTTSTGTATGTALSSSVTVLQVSSRRKVITVIPSGAAVAGAGAPPNAVASQNAAPMSMVGEPVVSMSQFLAESDTDPMIITVGVTTTLQAPEGGKKKKKNKDKKKKAAAAAAIAAEAETKDGAAPSSEPHAIGALPLITPDINSPERNTIVETQPVLSTELQEAPKKLSKAAKKRAKEQLTNVQSQAEKEEISTVPLPERIPVELLPQPPTTTTTAQPTKSSPPAPIGDDEDGILEPKHTTPLSTPSQAKPWPSAFLADQRRSNVHAPTTAYITSGSSVSKPLPVTSAIAGAPIVFKQKAQQSPVELTSAHQSGTQQQQPMQPFAEVLKRMMSGSNTMQPSHPTSHPAINTPKPSTTLVDAPATPDTNVSTNNNAAPGTVPHKKHIPAGDQSSEYKVANHTTPKPSTGPSMTKISKHDGTNRDEVPTKDQLPSTKKVAVTIPLTSSVTAAAAAVSSVKLHLATAHSAVTFKNAFAALAKKEKKPMAAALAAGAAQNKSIGAKEPLRQKSPTPSAISSRAVSEVMCEAGDSSVDKVLSTDADKSENVDVAPVEDFMKSSSTMPDDTVTCNKEESKRATKNPTAVTRCYTATPKVVKAKSSHQAKEDENALLDRLMSQNALIHKGGVSAPSGGNGVLTGGKTSTDKKHSVGSTFTSVVYNPQALDQRKRQEELFGITYEDVLKMAYEQMRSTPDGLAPGTAMLTFDFLSGCQLFNFPPLQLTRSVLPPKTGKANPTLLNPNEQGPIYYEEGSLLVLESLVLAERLRRQCLHVAYHSYFAKDREAAIRVLSEGLRSAKATHSEIKVDTSPVKRAEALVQFLLPFDSAAAAHRVRSELLSEAERLVFPPSAPIANLHGINSKAATQPRGSKASARSVATSTLVDDTEDLLDELLDYDESTSSYGGCGGRATIHHASFDALAMIVCDAISWASLSNEVFLAAAENKNANGLPGKQASQTLNASVVRQVATETSPLYRSLMASIKKANDEVNSRLNKPLSTEALATISEWYGTYKKESSSSSENPVAEGAPPNENDVALAVERDQWLLEECQRCERESIALFVARYEYVQWYMAQKVVTHPSRKNAPPQGGNKTFPKVGKGKGKGQSPLMTKINTLPSPSLPVTGNIQSTACSADISCLFFLELSEMYLDVDKGFEYCRRASHFAEEYQVIIDAALLTLPAQPEEQNDYQWRKCDTGITRTVETFFGTITAKENEERQTQSQYLTMMTSLFSGRYHERNVEGADAKSLLLNALQYAIILKEPAVVARSAFVLGMAVELLGKFKDALRWIQIARVLSLQLGHEKWFVDFTVQMASSLSAIGRCGSGQRECLYALGCERRLQFGPTIVDQSSSVQQRIASKILTPDEIERKCFERQTFAVDVFATALKHYAAHPPSASQTIGGLSFVSALPQYNNSTTNASAANGQGGNGNSNAASSAAAATVSNVLKQQHPISPAVAAVYHTAVVCMLGNRLDPFNTMSTSSQASVDQPMPHPIDPFHFPYAAHFARQLEQIANGRKGTAAAANASSLMSTIVPASLQTAAGQQSFTHCIASASSNSGQSGDVCAAFLSHLEELFVHIIVCASADWIAEALTKARQWDWNDPNSNHFISSFPFPVTDDTGAFVQAWSYVTNILRALGFIEASLAVQTYEYKLMQLYPQTHAQIRRDGECLQSAATTMRIMCEAGVGQVLTRKTDATLLQGYRYLPFVPSAGGIVGTREYYQGPLLPHQQSSSDIVAIYATETLLTAERIDALISKGRESTRKSKLLCLNVGDHTVAAKGISELADFESKEAVQRAMLALTGVVMLNGTSPASEPANDNKVAANSLVLPVSKLAKKVFLQPTDGVHRQRLCPNIEAHRLSPATLPKALIVLAKSHPGSSTDSSVVLASSLVADLYRSIYSGYEASLELEKVTNRQNYHVKVSVCETEWRLFDALERAQVQVGDLYGALKSCERRHIPNTIDGTAILRRRSGLPVHAHKTATQRLNMAGIGLSVDRSVYPQGHLTSGNTSKVVPIAKYSASTGCPSDLITKFIEVGESSMKTNHLETEYPYILLTPEEAAKLSMIHPTAPLTPAQQHQLLAVQNLLKHQHDRRGKDVELRPSCDVETPMLLHSTATKQSSKKQSSCSVAANARAAATYEELLLDTAQHFLDLKTVDLEHLRKFVEGGGTVIGSALAKWRAAVNAPQASRPVQQSSKSPQPGSHDAAHALLCDEQFMAELASEVTPCPFSRIVVFSTYWSDEELIGCFVIERKSVSIAQSAENNEGCRYEMKLHHRWLRLSANSISVVLNPSSKYLRLCESSSTIYDTPLFPTHIHQLARYATDAVEEDIATANATLKKEFSYLYDDLIRPIHDLLFDQDSTTTPTSHGSSSVPSVCFVSDGFLSHLPFNALYNTNGSMMLPNGDSNKAGRLTTEKPFFLVEKLLVTVLPSLLHLGNLVAKQLQLAVEEVVAAAKASLSPSYPTAHHTATTVHSVVSAYVHDEDVLPLRFLSAPTASSTVVAAIGNDSNRCAVRAYTSTGQASAISVVQHLQCPEGEVVMDSPYNPKHPTSSSLHLALQGPQPDSDSEQDSIRAAAKAVLENQEAMLAPYCGTLLTITPTLSLQQRSLAQSNLSTFDGLNKERSSHVIPPPLSSGSKTVIEVAMSAAADSVAEILKEAKDTVAGNCLFKLLHSPPKIASDHSSTGALILNLPCGVDLREEYCGHLCLSNTRFLASSGEIAAVWDLGTHKYPVCILPTFGRFAIRAIHETSAPVYRSLLVAGVPRLMLPLWLLPDDQIVPCRQLFIDAVLRAIENNAQQSTEALDSLRRKTTTTTTTTTESEPVESLLNRLPSILTQVCALRLDVGIVAGLREKMVEEIGRTSGCDEDISRWAYWSTEGLP